MSKHKVIIDTDPGIDDAMAILYACLEPEIELIGLTSIFGNVTTGIATRNALALLELAGVDAPVARGAEHPLVQEPKKLPGLYMAMRVLAMCRRLPPILHQSQKPRMNLFATRSNQNPGEIVLCPVGPLTNLALALEHDPSIVGKVKSVTIMGGSLDDGGNATEYAEANIWQDPHAAEKVFSAGWQVNMMALMLPTEFCVHRRICCLTCISAKTGRLPQ